MIEGYNMISVMTVNMYNVYLFSCNKMIADLTYKRLNIKSLKFLIILHRFKYCQISIMVFLIVFMPQIKFVRCVIYISIEILFSITLFYTHRNYIYIRLYDRV